MDISVILVNYNTSFLTIECINSIYSTTKNVNYEIIVIDNASIDGSVVAIKEKFPEVIIIESSTNIGFGRANNLATTHAKGKYLFFLNTDTKILNNSIKVFFDFYENIAPENTGAIGGILLNPDLSIGWSYNKFNSIGRILKWYYFRVFDTKREFFNLALRNNIKIGEFIYTDYVTGADIFIPTKLFNNIGGFDSSLFLYYEDEELQFRLQNEGYKSLIIGGTKIIHYEGGSMKNERGKVPNQKRIITEKSLFYYLRKKNGRIYAFFGKIVYFILISIPLRMQYSYDDNKEYLSNYLRF